jgi:hypothetical protein
MSIAVVFLRSAIAVSERKNLAGLMLRPMSVARPLNPAALAANNGKASAGSARVPMRYSLRTTALEKSASVGVIRSLGSIGQVHESPLEPAA